MILLSNSKPRTLKSVLKLFHRRSAHAKKLTPNVVPSEFAPRARISLLKPFRHDEKINSFAEISSINGFCFAYTLVINRLGEEGLHPGRPGGSMTQGGSPMGFAEAVAGNEYKPFLFFKKSEFHDFEKFGVGDGRGAIPVKGVQGFDLGKFSGG